ncbi:hypothetical protein F0562_016235 [Nyssa sinensis]|uniref:Uncharacterized protein n=1 Tax=Nyssa sinensis TaxID=561372 RepID=A0A5J4ZPK3_9ASTE|nr:hypothetical protein F0562_016235 [Nyssa sinensis]
MIFSLNDLASLFGWGMASLSHSPVTFTGNLAPVTSASDLLRSSSNGISGVPLKALGRARLGSMRGFTITAKVRKVKKHEYPWPDDAGSECEGRSP